MDSSGERRPATKTAAEDRRRLLAVGRADPFLVTKLPQNGVVSKGIVQLEGGGILGFAHQPLPEGTRVRVAYQEWLYAERLPDQSAPGEGVPVEEIVAEEGVAAESGAEEGGAEEGGAEEGGAEEGGAEEGVAEEGVAAESVAEERTMAGEGVSTGVAEVSTETRNEVDRTQTAEDRSAHRENAAFATGAPGSRNASPGDASTGDASGSHPSSSNAANNAVNNAANSAANSAVNNAANEVSNDAFPEDLARGEEVPTVGEDGERRSWTDAFGTISGGGFDRES